MTVQEVIHKHTVVIDTGCWIWTGAINHNGYAHVRIGGAIQRAHRVSYEHFVGPIPEGLVLDHRCRNRHCVSPHHLEPVTQKVNVNRAMRWKRG